MRLERGDRVCFEGVPEDEYEVVAQSYSEKYTWIIRQPNSEPFTVDTARLAKVTATPVAEFQQFKVGDRVRYVNAVAEQTPRTVIGVNGDYLWLKRDGDRDPFTTHRTNVTRIKPYRLAARTLIGPAVTVFLAIDDGNNAVFADLDRTMVDEWVKERA